jgi:CRP/FNR family transcriptional regulator, cyclic AMP receptor protein
VEYELLGHLPEDQRRPLLASMTRRRFRRGETIFHEGDPGETLHLVAKGRVAIRTSTPQGDVATFVVLRPGECFGELALVGGTNRRGASAVAVEASETLTLHRNRFDELRRTQPAVDQFLIAVLSEDVRRMSRLAVECMYGSAEIRVLRRLLDLTKAFDDGEPTVNVPMTQEDLATMAGTTRPTANRVLHAGAQSGFLRLKRGRIEVLDVEALAHAAR